MTNFRERRATSIENEYLRVTVLQEGGHIAEILDKATGINPLWTPPWPSIEPSRYGPWAHRGLKSDLEGAEGKLLAGITGHNLCLDIFGGPSAEEAAAGLTVHGEASIERYKFSQYEGVLTMRARLPIAQINFERRVELRGRGVVIGESVDSLASFDRPIAWTQHVTLGPPFLECGATQFRSSATRSKVFETTFGAHDYLHPGAEFDWPFAPMWGGPPGPPGRTGRSAPLATADLRVMNAAASSSAFTTHLMDPAREHAFFVAFAPVSRLAFGYVWKQADFPWMGIWEENHSRTHAPWNGQTLARGMEFGASPMPETRRQMIERGALFGVPGYRWLPAKGRLKAEYWAIMAAVETIPEQLEPPL